MTLKVLQEKLGSIKRRYEGGNAAEKEQAWAELHELINSDNRDVWLAALALAVELNKANFRRRFQATYPLLANDWEEYYQRSVVTLLFKMSRPNREMITNIGGYLFEIAEGHVKNDLRKIERRKTEMTETMEQQQLNDFQDMESQVRAILEQIYGKDSVCANLFMAIFVGYDQKEIAEKVNLTEGRISQKKGECREKLFKELQLNSADFKNVKEDNSLFRKLLSALRRIFNT